VYCPSDPLDKNSPDVINIVNEVSTSCRKKYIRGMSFIREEMVNCVTELNLTYPLTVLYTKENLCSLIL
jgi:hypothetical protein